MGNNLYCHNMKTALPELLFYFDDSHQCHYKLLKIKKLLNNNVNNYINRL